VVQKGVVGLLVWCSMCSGLKAETADRCDAMVGSAFGRLGPLLLGIVRR